MKKRRFVLLAAAVAVTAVFIFAGCSHTFTCGLCGKEVNEAGHQYTVLGREVEICDSCYNGLQDITNGNF